MFYGEKLLTTGNPEHEADQRLMADLGIRAMAVEAAAECHPQPAAADGDAAAA